MISVKVLTPEGMVFEGPGTSVVVETTDGSIGIWPGHIGLMALKEKGLIRIQQDGQSSILDIGPGYTVVEHDRVQLLVESAVNRSS